MEKHSVLIVEDEMLVAKHIEKIITSNGYKSSGIVSTGEDAINVTELCKPSLVLMDIVLKGDMDGIDAANSIRKKYGLPVIFLTAHYDDRILKRAKKTMPYGYLTKPFDEKNLMILIEMSIYKAGKERERNDLLQEKEYMIREREKALDNIKILKGILPICSYCNNIRNEDGKWEKFVTYIKNHSEADFSHSICPECMKKYYPDIE